MAFQMSGSATRHHRSQSNDRLQLSVQSATKVCSSLARKPSLPQFQDLHSLRYDRKRSLSNSQSLLASSANFLKGGASCRYNTNNSNAINADTSGSEQQQSRIQEIEARWQKLKPKLANHLRAGGGDGRPAHGHFAPAPRDICKVIANSCATTRHATRPVYDSRQSFGESMEEAEPGEEEGGKVHVNRIRVFGNLWSKEHSSEPTAGEENVEPECLPAKPLVETHATDKGAVNSRKDLLLDFLTNREQALPACAAVPGREYMSQTTKLKPPAETAPEKTETCCGRPRSTSRWQPSGVRFASGLRVSQELPRARRVKGRPSDIDTTAAHVCCDASSSGINTCRGTVKKVPPAVSVGLHRDSVMM